MFYAHLVYPFDCCSFSSSVRNVPSCLRLNLFIFHFGVFGFLRISWSKGYGLICVSCSSKLLKQYPRISVQQTSMTDHWSLLRELRALKMLIVVECFWRDGQDFSCWFLPLTRFHISSTWKKNPNSSVNEQIFRIWRACQSKEYWKHPPRTLGWMLG